MVETLAHVQQNIYSFYPMYILICECVFFIVRIQLPKPLQNERSLHEMAVATNHPLHTTKTTQNY